MDPQIDDATADSRSSTWASTSVPQLRHLSAVSGAGPTIQDRSARLHIDPQSSWHWGFAAAGIGMTSAWFNTCSQKAARTRREPSRKASSRQKAAAEPLTRTEINRLIVIGILFVFSSLFWMAFEQAGSSLNLFAKSLTRNSIFGFEFPQAGSRQQGQLT
jgi:dipeptide/tripeptide permease